ncbi:MAG: site-specific DNA-methyltransferase [Rhodoplanes sp.]|uniref:DNA-methyltransferase n=1 Tax=Rhodoplanes sp. TaxID=1968906 RepID=UPI00184FDD3B|nr:site-specific DNA-methyltransferase [Rhodoplanes sp.]NVO13851.1 site-specific DNA-methyltransferase [Rhodoplanes sp.]
MTASTHTLTDAVTLFHADMREALRVLPDSCIDSVVTDPPYHLTSVVKRFGGEGAAPAKHGTDGLYARQSAGFMGKQWDGGDIAFQAATWAEVMRVLKPGGHMVAFGGSRGYHRMACAIEDAGFEIRDSLMWIYGTGFPKSHDVAVAIDKAARGVSHGGSDPFSPNHGKYKGGCSDENDRGQGFGSGPGQFMREQGVKVERELCDEAAEWEGWGTALKPAFEPIVLARKSCSEKTVAANVIRWRTGALNIGACRIEATPGDYSTGGKNDLTGTGWGHKDASRTEQHPAGRWPANALHDGSPEVLGAFPETTSGGGARNSPKAAGIYGGFSGEEATREFAANSGSAARFFYSAKASAVDRAGSKHPTVKPVALMSWLVRLVTPPGGVILDPFAGSGTTGAAAQAEGLRCILIEREAEYVQDIVSRFAR